MNFRSFLKACFLCFIVFIIAAAAFLWHKSEWPPLGQGPFIEYPSASAAEAQQFLHGEFSIITDVRKLPSPVLASFTEQGGSRLVIANPSENFRATDVVYDATLPSKRLIFAGVSGQKCFIHYEQGGIGHSYVLALFEIPSMDRMKPVSGIYCGGRADSLEELRSWVRDGTCRFPK